MYTDAVAKDSYDTLDDILNTKMSNPELRSVINTMFNACGTITEALRKELVTVAEKQASVFGDVQLVSHASHLHPHRTAPPLPHTLCL